MDETRRADGALDLAERTRVLHVVAGRTRKIRVVPNIEEIRREAEALCFRQAEVLDQRKVPILLEGAAINVAVERAKASSTSIRIEPTACGVSGRGWSEVAVV